MKNFLTELKYYFDYLAIIAGTAVALYGVVIWGQWAALGVAFSALFISAILKLSFRMIAKKENPMFTLSLKIGAPCTVGECEPGFFLFGETLCYKNEYDESFIVSSGEMFWGGAHTKEAINDLMVTPLINESANHP